MQFFKNVFDLSINIFVIKFITHTLKPFLNILIPFPGKSLRMFAGRNNLFSILIYSRISLSQIWFPEVKTSIPHRNNSSATFFVMPFASFDAFSPLAITKSILFFLMRFGNFFISFIAAERYHLRLKISFYIS